MLWLQVFPSVRSAVYKKRDATAVNFIPPEDISPFRGTLSSALIWSQLSLKQRGALYRSHINRIKHADRWSLTSSISDFTEPSGNDTLVLNTAALASRSFKKCVEVWRQAVLKPCKHTDSVPSETDSSQLRPFSH